MGLSGYNYNPLVSNFDFASMMNNPYFLYAYNSPNVNFKGGTDSAKQTSNVSTNLENTNIEGGIPVSTDVAAESGSSLGTVCTVGSILALGGGALYMLKKGKLGKAKDAVKSMFGGSSEAGTKPINK